MVYIIPGQYNYNKLYIFTTKMVENNRTESNSVKRRHSCDKKYILHVQNNYRGTKHVYGINYISKYDLLLKYDISIRLTFNLIFIMIRIKLLN